MPGAALGETRGANEALATQALTEARWQFEDRLFDDAYQAQQTLGRQRLLRATTAADLVDLQSEQRALERQTDVVQASVDYLRKKLRKQLGTWLELDDLHGRRDAFQESVKHLEAVRNSWTFRIAWVAAWPLRTTHALVTRLLRRRSKPQ